MSKVQLPAGTGLFPVPAVMISCASVDAGPDIVTVAWTGVVCSEPPMVSISLRESRHSHHIIADSREFVLNIPSEEQVAAMDYCGLVSGRDHDKFKECGFTAEKPSKLGYAPLIKECPVNLECKVHQVHNLGSHNVFIAEVVAVHANEEIVENNRVKHDAAKPICYAGSTYYALGQPVARVGAGKEIKNRQA